MHASETPGATPQTRLRKTTILATIESRYPKMTSWTPGEDDELDTRHSCMKHRHVVVYVNWFCSEGTYVLGWTGDTSIHFLYHV